MSINTCSINGHTINALRCRRALVRPAIPEIRGTNNSSLATRFAKYRPELVRHVPAEIEEPHLEFELPYIEVHAELLGQVGSMRLSSTKPSVFVSAFDLKLDAAAESPITVNITDFDL